jgi:ABC-2 type transport system ATP-binding protein
MLKGYRCIHAGLPLPFQTVAIIEMRQLTRRYGRRIGVEAIDLSIPEGSVHGFLGPNGAGKTTAIRVLLGLLKPTHGAANVFGLDCWKDSHKIKIDVGYMPGDFRLYPWMTGREALRIAGLARRRDLMTAGPRLADRFDLDLDVRVRNMSRGMRQKLGLILAMAHEPRLLILDEPSGALDPIMQERMDQHLRDLASRGHTVFFSSHTLAEVERLCDRVAIVRAGRLVANETITALRQRATRQIVIRWKDLREAAQPPPEFLEVFERGPRQWVATLRGPVQPLMQWLAAQPLEDVAIGQPDLETLFRSFYRQEIAS